MPEREVSETLLIAAGMICGLCKRPSQTLMGPVEDSCLGTCPRCMDTKSRAYSLTRKNPESSIVPSLRENRG